MVVGEGQALDCVDLDPLLPKLIEPGTLWVADFYHVTVRLAEIAVAMHGETVMAVTASNTELKQ